MSKESDLFAGEQHLYLQPEHLEPAAVDTFTLPSEEERQYFIETLQENIADTRRYKKDTLDLQVGLRRAVISLGLGAGSLATFKLLPGSNVWSDTAAIVAAFGGITVAVEGVSTPLQKKLQKKYEKKPATTSFGHYSVEIIRASQVNKFSDKGEVFAAIHPPQENEGNNRAIVLELEELSQLFELLQQIEGLDGIIVPHDGGSMSLDRVMKLIKGHSIHTPYPKGQMADVLTPEMLQGQHDISIILAEVTRRFPSIAAYVRTNDTTLQTNVIQDLLLKPFDEAKGGVERVRTHDMDDTPDGSADDKSENPPSSHGFVPVDIKFTPRAAVNKATGVLFFYDENGQPVRQTPIKKLVAETQDTQTIRNWTDLELLAAAYVQLLGKEESDKELHDTQTIVARELHPRRSFSRENRFHVGPYELPKVAARMSVVGAATVLALAGVYELCADTTPPSVNRSEHTLGPIDSDQLSHVIRVRSFGGMAIGGYYADSASYELNGKNLTWYPDDERVYGQELPTEPPQQPYIEVAKIVDYNAANDPYIGLEVKDGTKVYAVRVENQKGEVVPVRVSIDSSGVTSARPLQSSGRDMYKVVSYLTSAEETRTIIPTKPAVVYDTASLNDPFLKKMQAAGADVPSTEEHGAYIKSQLKYNTGDQLAMLLEGATAENLPSRTRFTRIGNCATTATVLALERMAINGVVMTTDEKVAYTTGISFDDTGRQGEEYINLGHAWLETEVGRVDPTPNVVDGTPSGIQKISQLDQQFAFNEQVRKQRLPAPSSKLPTFAFFAGLTGAVVASAKRRTIMSYAHKAGDVIYRLRAKVYPPRITQAEVEKVLAYQSYGVPEDLQAMDFSSQGIEALRLKIAAGEGITERSVAKDAVSSVLRGVSPLVNILYPGKIKRREVKRIARRFMRRHFSK